MLSPRLVRLYREVRQHYGPCFPGRAALDSLSAARTLLRWQAAESSGYVRLRAEPDPYYDPDDFEPPIPGPAYGTIAEYRTSLDSEDWQHADSCWGHTGYRDVLDWRENPYILDEMRECLDRFKAARKRTVLASPVPAY